MNIVVNEDLSHLVGLFVLFNGDPNKKEIIFRGKRFRIKDETPIDLEEVLSVEDFERCEFKELSPRDYLIFELYMTHIDSFLTS